MLATPSMVYRAYETQDLVSTTMEFVTSCYVLLFGTKSVRMDEDACLL